jgi:hypothetical protein
MTTDHRTPTGQCRFGVVPFGVLWDPMSEASMPVWRRNAIAATHHIPGSNRTQTMLLGQGPLRASYRLLLDTEDAYYLLTDYVQTEAELIVYAPMSRGIRGDEIWILDKPYKRIADVLLWGLAEDQQYIDGSIETVATFQKASR